MERAEEALAGWLEAHLASGQAPPEPKKLRSKGRGRTIEVPVPAKLAVKLAVRWARKRAGMTQADLARRAGLTQPAVARLEDPDYNPTLDMLERVAAALGTRLEVDLQSRLIRACGKPARPNSLCFGGADDLLRCRARGADAAGSCHWKRAPRVWGMFAPPEHSLNARAAGPWLSFRGNAPRDL